MNKTCKECGNDFNTDTSARLFCSRRCYGKWRSMHINGITYIEKECPKCRIIFSVPLSAKKQKFCSKSCFIESCKGRVGDKNPFYGRKHPNPSGGMLGKKHTQETRKKMSKARKGKKFTKQHRENISKALRKNSIDLTSKRKKEKQRIRKTAEYKSWREEVFSRDDWTCQDCNIRSGDGKAVYLEAHHIKSFKEYPEFRFEISNGKTLCKECHKIENKKQMKGNKNGIKRKG